MRLLICLITGLLLSSCSQTPTDATNNLPTAIGNTHQVLLVADEALMKTSLVDSIDYYISNIFKIVPNYENMLDIDVITPKEFRGYLKHRRNVLFISALDSGTPLAESVKNTLGEENVRKANELNSFRMATIKNKWAKGQEVVYLFSPTANELAEVIRKSSKKIISQFYEHDKPLVDASTFAGGLNKDAMVKVREMLGVQIEIPKGYAISSAKFIDSNTVWLRHQPRELGYNIIIRTMDYTEANQMTNENIIKIRDEIGKDYLSTRIKGSYLITEVQNAPLPVFQASKIDNQYALEARGLYKTIGDYMGGPFISYMVYDPNSKKMVFMDGFLQAPAKQQHREYMVRLESIMKTLKF